MKKRGQIFLLAAVIIVVLIIGLNQVLNSARINEEQTDVKNLAELVKKESGKVIDYEIYYSKVPNEDLDPFLKSLATSIREKDPKANFIIIFGNKSKGEIRNYAAEKITFCDRNNRCKTIGGGKRKIESRIKTATGYKKVTYSYDRAGDFWKSKFANVDEIEIIVRGIPFKFELKDYRQVIFIIQKDVKDESFISVK